MGASQFDPASERARQERLGADFNIAAQAEVVAVFRDRGYMSSRGFVKTGPAEHSSSARQIIARRGAYAAHDDGRGYAFGTVRRRESASSDPVARARPVTACTDTCWEPANGVEWRNAYPEPSISWEQREAVVRRALKASRVRELDYHDRQTVCAHVLARLVEARVEDDWKSLVSKIAHDKAVDVLRANDSRREAESSGNADDGNRQIGESSTPVDGWIRAERMHDCMARLIDRIYDADHLWTDTKDEARRLLVESGIDGWQPRTLHFITSMPPLRATRTDKRSRVVDWLLLNGSNTTEQIGNAMTIEAMTWISLLCDNRPTVINPSTANAEDVIAAEYEAVKKSVERACDDAAPLVMKDASHTWTSRIVVERASGRLLVRRVCTVMSAT